MKIFLSVYKKNNYERPIILHSLRLWLVQLAHRSVVRKPKGVLIVAFPNLANSAQAHQTPAPENRSLFVSVQCCECDACCTVSVQFNRNSIFVVYSGMVKSGPLIILSFCMCTIHLLKVST